MRQLFEDVSFHINERERVALIGPNGSGKTTLLKIICNEEQADGGFVNKEPGITIGYLPQEVDLPGNVELHLAVMGVNPELLQCATELQQIERQLADTSHNEAHALGNKYAEISHRFDNLHGFDYQIRANAILVGLGFDESDFNKPIQTLSGGQKTRAALARLLLLAPDVLLLDEPTNHLDIQACDWLQTFLKERYFGAALIVSHDRYFMDHVVSKVVEIESGSTVDYPGNYSAYAQQKTERIEEQRKLYKLQQKEISRIESAIQTLFSDRKFSRRDNKIKQLERIKKLSRPGDQASVKVHFNTANRSGRDVVQMKGLAKAFPDKTLFSDFTFTVERGRKIGIVGPNGSGKTTLLKILSGRVTADAGEIEFGHNVEPVYFSQEFDHLVSERTVLAELLADADLTSGQARDLLAQFLFMGDDSFKRVEVLSGGEQCRLALAKVLAESPNLLLLDEPTNHLDIRSREALEEALRAFNGTVLVASHDRYLLDAVATEILEIKDGSWKLFLGNYSDYIERIHTGSAPFSSKPAVLSKTAAPAALRKQDSPVRTMERSIRDLGKQQKQNEADIERIESRMAEITEALASEEVYRDGTAGTLSKEYAELTSELESLYADWEDAGEQIRQLQAELDQT